ncbi:MAG: hydrogenase maturation protease [Catenulispora sp.]|nr:hydrogenase maturation protease [Catenulispora sp.]
MSNADPVTVPRTLVAGIGNVFLGDDGFGSEAARRLLAEPLPPGVSVVDYGIRGMHLAFDLLAGYDTLVLVDALPRGGTPGDVTVLEIGEEDIGDGEFDAHGMNPTAVLASLGRLGTRLPPRTFVVGCEPRDVSEGIGLTPEVAAAMSVALSAIRVLVSGGPVGATADAQTKGGDGDDPDRVRRLRIRSGSRPVTPTDDPATESCEGDPMHEIGYCAGVLEAVERRAAGRPVARIGVLVGARHCISPAAFEQSFHLVAEGGVAAGAGTEVSIAPMRASCAACSAGFETPEPLPACPDCHSTDVVTEGGDELMLQWVEYADGGTTVDRPGDVAVAVREDR